MGLEARRGRIYYYRKRRVNGRVVSTYAGSGPTAELMAQLDALELDEKEQTRLQEKARRLEFEASEPRINELERLAHLIARAALVAEGYHTHKRQWRRQRGKG